MRRSFLAFLTILLLVPAAARAGERCEITQHQAGGPLKERTRVVRFPDGREIVLVGHNHGDRDVPFRLSELAQSDSSQISNQDFISDVNALLKENAKAVEHAQEDVRFLRSLLEKNTDLKFIAVEATQAAADANLKFFKRLRDRHTAQLARRELPTSGKITMYSSSRRVP